MSSVNVTSSALWVHERRLQEFKLSYNKAIVDIRLRPRCALPSPRFRPIGRIACAQNFPYSYFRLPGILNDPFCCMTLLTIEWFHFAANAAATAAAKTVNAVEWLGQWPWRRRTEPRS